MFIPYIPPELTMTGRGFGLNARTINEIQNFFIFTSIVDVNGPTKGKQYAKTSTIVHVISFFLSFQIPQNNSIKRKRLNCMRAKGRNLEFKIF